jgi:hypothetical protein
MATTEVDSIPSPPPPSGVSTSLSRPKRPKGIKGFVWDYIMERYNIWLNGDQLDWILTSDVWYDLCKEGTIEEYYKAKHNDQSIKGPQAAKARVRETIQVKYVKDICDELEIRRADIKILAGDVGYVFFRGEKHAISLDDLASLKYNGTDLLIIEKEGIAQSLKDYADSYGIALLSTRGFLTENASDLVDLATNSGANVAILTDFDISGLVIAHKVPTVPRIGIDFATLDGLDISEDLVSDLKQGEYYTPDTGHLTYAEINMPDLEGLDFLRTRRIEINAVKNAAGPEELWNYIIRRLQEIYPNRDYNRALDVPKPSHYRPPELSRLVNLIDAITYTILQPDIARCRCELGNFDGFIEDVNDYEKELEVQFEQVLNGNGIRRSKTASSGVSTPAQSAKNFLKGLRKDLGKLLKKYGNEREEKEEV